MSRYKVLYKNTLIFTLSNFASKVLGFLMLPLYTRVLTREEFGSGDLIILTVGLLMPLLTLSISESALRFSLAKDENKSQVFSFGLKLIAGGFLLILLLLPIALLIPVIRDYTLFFYLIYFSQSLNQYFNQFTRGIDKIKLIGIVGVIQTIVTVLSNIILLVVFNFGVEGFLLSIIIANMVALSILFFWANLKHYITFEKIDKKLKKEMLKYSVPLTPNRLSWWLNNSANKYIISGYAGVSELGLFSAASRIPSILITFQNIFIQAWRLSAINEFNKENSSEFFTNIYKVYNLFMLIGCSLLILFIKPIATILFGDDIYEAWRFAPFLLISVIFGALIGFLESISIASKKTKVLFTTTLFGATIGIVLNVLFIPLHGALVASFSSTISYLSIFIYLHIYTRKSIKLNINFFKDSLSYILIVFESLSIIFIEGGISYYIATVCIALIFIINFKYLIELINLAKSFVNRKFSINN